MSKYEDTARALLPQIYDLAQGKGVASTLVIAIGAALQEAAEAERERLLNILGYDKNGDGLTSDQDHMGETIHVCHDPYYDLEGAIDDLERMGADAVCLRTLRRVQARFGDLVKDIRSR
jgi:hypothetical protein